jgi:hypothetical protein
MQRFPSLGTDCVKIQETADESKGHFSCCFALILFSFVDYFLLALYCVTFLFVVALNKALARVASLEAELKTTSQALKDANIAKASAKKAAKIVEVKAKKAKKALAEIAQKQSNREGAVLEQLDATCTFVGSKFFILPLCLSKVISVDMLFLGYLYFCDAAEQLGEVWKLRLESAKDPLLDAVEVLESNWRLARDVLQQTRHVLTHMFVRLFPRKKDELPTGNLWKLVKAFDTIEDPILAMKLTSVKRGVKGMIALAQLHGEEVDWEKVGSSYAQPPAEIKEFFKKAKEYAPQLVSLILPAPIPSTPAPGTSAPSSSTPAPTDPAATEVA